MDEVREVMVLKTNFRHSYPRLVDPQHTMSFAKPSEDVSYIRTYYPTSACRYLQTHLLHQVNEHEQVPPPCYPHRYPDLRTRCRDRMFCCCPRCCLTRRASESETLLTSKNLDP